MTRASVERGLHLTTTAAQRGGFVGEWGEKPASKQAPAARAAENYMGWDRAAHGKSDAIEKYLHFS